MGYSTRNNGQIRTFWPDDTYTEFYLEGSATLQQINEALAERNWNAATAQITPEHIQTDCLDYDLYDAGDWTYFLRISKE